MKKLFEYFYYRIAKLNFKDNRPERAIISVTATQCVVLINILMAISLMIFPEIKRKFNIFEMVFILAIFFGLDYYNNKLYKGRYEEFDAKWGNEPQKKKVINMIIITLVILISWGLIFVNAWIFGRFKTY